MGKPRTPEHFPKMKYRARKRHDWNAGLAAMAQFSAYHDQMMFYMNALAQNINRLDPRPLKWMLPEHERSVRAPVGEDSVHRWAQARPDGNWDV